MERWQKALHIMNLVLLPCLSFFVHIVTLVIIFVLGWTLNSYPKDSVIICRGIDIIVVITFILYALIRKRCVIIGGSYLACAGISCNLLLLAQTMKPSVLIGITGIAFSLLTLFIVNTMYTVLSLRIRNR